MKVGHLHEPTTISILSTLPFLNPQVPLGKASLAIYLAMVQPTIAIFLIELSLGRYGKTYSSEMVLVVPLIVRMGNYSEMKCFAGVAVEMVGNVLQAL